MPNDSAITSSSARRPVRPPTGRPLRLRCATRRLAEMTEGLPKEMATQSILEVKHGSWRVIERNVDDATLCCGVVAIAMQLCHECSPAVSHLVQSFSDGDVIRRTNIAHLASRPDLPCTALLVTERSHHPGSSGTGARLYRLLLADEDRTP